MGGFSDLSPKNIQVIKGATSGNKAEVNDIKELNVNDVPQQGVSAVLNLTTTAQILKVGASALADRKFIEMQATSKNVKWGYNTTCEFDLFKNQFFALPCGESCTLYLKASTGTATVAVSEK